MHVRERKVIEEQGGFRKEKLCVDQVFPIEIMVEEYL